MDGQNFELTTAEATALIEMLKKALVDTINLPNGSQRKIEFEVEGTDKHERFIIAVFTGNKNPKKHNFGARISRNGTLLLELHLAPNAPHYNPDGTKFAELTDLVKETGRNDFYLILSSIMFVSGVLVLARKKANA